MLRLAELKRPYDYCISLGSDRLPAVALKNLNLSQEGMPLDTVTTTSTKKVVQLLEKRFQNYMDLGYLVIKYPDFANGKLVVEDSIHGVVSHYDFDIYGNTVSTLNTYSKFKEELNKKIDTFNNALKEGQSFLFIRTQVESQEDAKLLKNALDNLVGPERKAYLLIINYIDFSIMKELNWGINDVCVVEIPYQDSAAEKTQSNFGYILHGVTIRHPNMRPRFLNPALNESILKPINKPTSLTEPMTNSQTSSGDQLTSRKLLTNTRPQSKVSQVPLKTEEPKLEMRQTNWFVKFVKLFRK